ncbi:MAG TPA: PE domain-containing protein [Pseudonocardiaceae bacterium]|nr:PE domain-containing protein [Pseudonocardiaceae bacterium]
MDDDRSVMGAPLAMTDPSNLRDQQLNQQITSDEVVAVVDAVNGRLGYNPAAHGGMGKGYTFSPEQIETQITGCSKLLTSLNNRLQTAEQAVEHFSVAPAGDPVSQRMSTGHSNWSGDLATSITNKITETQQWMDQLKQAKANYMAQEHLSEAQWHRLTLGLEA